MAFQRRIANGAIGAALLVVMVGILYGQSDLNRAWGYGYSPSPGRPGALAPLYPEASPTRAEASIYESKYPSRTPSEQYGSQYQFASQTRDPSGVRSGYQSMTPGSRSASVASPHVALSRSRSAPGILGAKKSGELGGSKGSGKLGGGGN